MRMHQITVAASVLAAFCTTGVAHAQAPGETRSTTLSVSESTHVVNGWSVKKTLMGKVIFDDGGHMIGRIDDLIISPDRSLSYVIVGAGGFVGLGRHDVAFAVAQVQDRSGKLVIPGVTRDSVKAMATFDDTYDSDQRNRFIAAAERDIADGRAEVIDLESETDVLTAKEQVTADRQLSALRAEIKVADAKLTELKLATAVRWKEFQAGVSTATARLRKAVDIAED